MRSAETSATTRQEAIQLALEQLGIEMSDVEQIKILDEGSRGLFGIGARPVRVEVSTAIAAPEVRRPQRSERAEGGGRRGRQGDGDRAVSKGEGERSRERGGRGGQRGRGSKAQGAEAKDGPRSKDRAKAAEPTRGRGQRAEQNGDANREADGDGESKRRGTRRRGGRGRGDRAQRAEEQPTSQVSEAAFQEGRRKLLGDLSEGDPVEPEVTERVEAQDAEGPEAAAAPEANAPVETPERPKKRASKPKVVESTTVLQARLQAASATKKRGRGRRGRGGAKAAEAATDEAGQQAESAETPVTTDAAMDAHGVDASEPEAQPHVNGGVAAGNAVPATDDPYDGTDAQGDADAYRDDVEQDADEYVEGESEREEPVYEPVSDALATEAAAMLQEVIRLMGIEATVVYSRAEDEAPRLTISTEDSALLIGRKGRTLGALQYIVNRMIVQGETSENLERLIVDVEGYVDRRRESLEGLAHAMADKAKQAGRNMRLNPMSPQERRIIHLALQDDSDVRTFSVGEALFRSVVISPKNAKQDRESRDGSRGRRGGRRGRGGGQRARTGGGDRSAGELDAGTFGD